MKILAIVLSHKKLDIRKFRDAIVKEIVCYCGVKPTYVMTNCNHSSDPLFCYSKHPRTIGDFIFLIIEIYRLVFILREKIDCLVVWSSIIAFFILPIKIFLQKKIYVVQLGNWPEVLYWKALYMWNSKIATLVEKTVNIIDRIVVSAADEIITNSPSFIRKHRLEKIRLRFAFRCISKSFFNQLKIEKKKTDHRKLELVFISRLDYEKGVFLMLKGFVNFLKRQNIYRPKLHIYGSGPLETIVKKLSEISSHIVYHGHVDREFLLKYVLTDAKCLVIPSYTEGYPNILIEALVCGVPIIIINDALDESIKRHASYTFSNDKDLSDILLYIFTK